MCIIVHFIISALVYFTIQLLIALTTSLASDHTFWGNIYVYIVGFINESHFHYKVFQNKTYIKFRALSYGIRDIPGRSGALIAIHLSISGFTSLHAVLHIVQDLIHKLSHLWLHL